jgi:hypothetical protein
MWVAGKNPYQTHLKVPYQNLPGEAVKTGKSDVRTEENAAEIEPNAFQAQIWVATATLSCSVW